MFIDEITLNNFRNIKKETVLPSQGINIFLGKNAQGKTNFIESIYLISNLKSFRGKKIDEMINRDSRFAKIKINTINKKVSNTIFFEFEKNSKSLRLNNKKTKKLSESLGYLNTILFYPDDILIVKGSPSLRRNLIDRAILQIDNSYLKLFKDYLRCLKQRNSALKEKKNNHSQWDFQFIEIATKLTFKRIEYIKKINEILNNLFEDVYKCGEKVNIKYLPNISDTQEFKNLFTARLEASSKKEKLYCSTLIGPHRDDLHFLLDDQSLSLYGSQGQQRSFMLAFKTAQIIDFRNCRGISPVLLLDDMASELDEERKDTFFESLLNQAGQVFITTTDFNLLENRRFKDASIFKVENGEIDQYN